MKVAYSRFFLGTLLVAAVAALGACELVASVDRDKIDEGIAGAGGNPDGGKDADVFIPDVTPDKPNDVANEGDAPPASCTNNVKDGTESDVDCGGSCKKCAIGDDCTKGTDCVDGVCSTSTKKCVAASCTDTVKNGTETDVDCGGTCTTKCAAGKDCNGDGDCVTGKCNASKKCAGAACDDTILNGDETDVDCGGSCPTKCSDTKKCKIDGDCGSGFCDPTNQVCNPAACDNTHKDSNETDVDCGGSCTTKCAVGKGCAGGNDCVDGVCDTNANPKVCLAATCTDTVANGDETDVDCGGSCAPTSKCADTKKCKVGGDCTSGYCDATQLVCAPATCNDTVLNGDETDVDCGGTCPKCADTKICKINNDCVSLNCGTGLTCVAATCSDNIKNQGETDIDCGGDQGTTDCPRCADAKACAIDGDCLTNHACDPSTTTCVQCLANANCALGKLCDTTLKTCTINGCVAGSHECPGTETCCTGSCSDLTADPQHCGACGTACSNNHVPTPTCAASVCTGVCENGYGDCNLNKATDGCEVSLQTDVNNCSACGTVCSANHVTAACAGGVCNGACESGGWTDCNTNKQTDGCEANTQTEPAHCGTCSNVCNLANAVEGCAAGACTIASCNSGFGDCNTTASDGCEVNTNTTPAHCGSCTNACNLPNAVEGCASGACTIASCNTGFGDCNTTASDGCEVNTNTTPAHCGACNTPCNLPNATAGCASGACTIASCTGSFKDCNTTASDGCEINTDTTPAHCGACNTPCNLPNATAGCASGACTIASCTGSFKDCNTTASDGCEINTDTNAAHCGACNHACGNGGTCPTGGLCVCGAAGTCPAGKACATADTCEP
ncbi:MAG: hypothetical protein HY898_28255 [Deltaproteobacteria bacterium]|nr:hypothetical protein [Deltaproteobacteria bacterium]